MCSAVDRNESVASRCFKRQGHVVNPQRDVMNALTMLGEKHCNVGFFVAWLEQLDAHGAGTEEGDPHIWKRLFATKVKAQRSLEMWTGFVD